MLRYVWIVCFAALSANASINTSNHLALGLGDSVQKGTLDWQYQDFSGPSRNGGGERLLLKFRTPKHITGIRLTASSVSGVGQVLIRDARARSYQGSKTIETSLIELFKYNKAVNNDCMSFNNLCLLPNGGRTSTLPNDTYSEIEFAIEGFQRSDASILIEFDSNDPIAYTDFLLSRTGPSSYDGLLGAFIDEAHYSRLQAREWRTMMRFAYHPGIERLDGATFVCTFFTKNHPPKVDFKTRHYFSPSPGTLQSRTDTDTKVNTWIQTQEGWKLPYMVNTPCGQILHNVVLRKTETGSLISEIVLERDAYIRACVNMGYDPISSEQGLNSGTYSSIIGARYAAGAYEYCRPARLK